MMNETDVNRYIYALLGGNYIINKQKVIIIRKSVGFGLNCSGGGGTGGVEGKVRVGSGPIGRNLRGKPERKQTTKQKNS